MTTKLKTNVSSLLLAVIDFGIILAIVIAVRTLLVASPKIDGTGLQWQLIRYFNVALVMGTIFIILAFVAGMFSKAAGFCQNKLVIVNLVNWTLIASVILYALYGYNKLNPEAELLSKKVVILAAIVLYFLTTLLHYFHAKITSKEKTI